jgi:hypothetical protein
MLKWLLWVHVNVFYVLMCAYVVAALVSAISLVMVVLLVMVCVWGAVLHLFLKGGQKVN